MSKDNRNENMKKENKRTATFDVEQGIQVQVPNGCFELSEAYGIVTRGVKLDAEADANVDGSISKKVVPYMNSVAIFDLAQFDENPNHTSLPSGTYNGTEYTHSSTTLSAKYPKLAASLTPIVDNVLSKYSWEINYTNETLIIDAIGCAIANSISGYAEALAFKRALNVKNVRDEDDLPMAPLFNSNSEHGDTKGITGWYVPVTGTNVDSDNTENAVLLTGQIMSNYNEISTGETDFYSYSQSKMDNIINANLSRLFVSNKAKALINIIFGNFIKMRYADADTDRYLTFITREHAELAGDGYLTNAVHFEQIVRDNSDVVKALTNRFTFLPEILNAIGAKRLDASSTPGREGQDRVTFDKTGLTFNAIYDDHDFFKNIIDHCAINSTVYHYRIANNFDVNPTSGDATGNKLIAAYQALIRNYVSTELDSYIGHTLEYGDSAILSDEVLNVTANDGVISMYNNYYLIQRNNYSTGAATTGEKMFVSSVSHPVHLSSINVVGFGSGENLHDFNALATQISVLNHFLIDVKSIDPVYDLTYRLNLTNVSGTYMDVSSVSIYYGLNSYVSHSGDMQLIKTYNAASILVDMDAINKINDNIAGKNNQSAN
jgi:hypothetical protein